MPDVTDRYTYRYRYTHTYNIYVYMCIYVCVYIYIYICVCGVCACVCARRLTHRHICIDHMSMGVSFGLTSGRSEPLLFINPSARDVC